MSARAAALGSVIAAFLAGPACGHDWSSSPADARGDGTDGDGPATDGDGEADRGDGGPACGNGVLEPPEQCERGDTQRCTAGACAGTRACGTACAWESCSLGPAPAGDLCDPLITPISDTGTARSFDGSTCGAANDAAPMICPGGAAGPDVFYPLVLAAAERVTLTVSDADYPVVLYVAGSRTCSSPPLACADGSATSTPGRPSLTVDLEAGTYWVGIDGATADDTGRYTLDAAFTAPALPPANDHCTDAEALAVPDGGGAGTVTWNTTAGTDDGATCVAATGPDVWYRLSLAQPAVVYLDTLDGEAWSSVVEVLPWSCTDATGGVACDKGSCGTGRSQLAVHLAAGEWAVVVDGVTDADRGGFTLAWRVVPSLCADASPLAADGRYSGDTTGGTDHLTPDCVPSTRSGADDLYFAALCAGAEFTASTCDAATDFDTVLALRADSCTGTGTPVACNDDTDTACVSGTPRVSEIAATVPSSGLYFLAVDGTSKWAPRTSAGHYELTVAGIGP